MRPYKGYIKDDINFRKLSENTVMLLGHFFENAYVFNKITKEEFGIFQFNSDPVCGLIGKNNDWCLVGGDILVLKTWVDKTLRVIGDLKHIHELRATNEYTVQILIDPWTVESAIWQLDIDLTKLTKPINLFKIRDFTDYINKPYTEQVIW
jgi:hypothetical protein